MDFNLLLVLTSALILSCIGHSRGLDCYECAHGYVDLVSYEKMIEEFKKLDVKVDYYCNSDRKPKDYSSTSCDEYEEDGNKLSCMALNVDETVNGSHVQFKLRGCFPSKASSFNVTQDCERKSLTELEKLFPDKPSKIQQAIKLAKEKFLNRAGLQDAESNTCFCDEDNCNSGGVLRPLLLLVLSTCGVILRAALPN